MIRLKGEILNQSTVRFLAFCLGTLLLFHGVYTLIHGTQFVKDLIIDYYAPYMQNEPCKLCIGGMMMGESFISSMMGMESTIKYPKYLTYLSYGVYIAEVIAPIFLIVGRYIKLSAMIIALDISLALFLVYRDNFFTLTTSGAWSAEVPMLYLILALTLLFNTKK